MKNVKTKIYAELVKPSLVYKDSFLEALKEFQTEGKNIYLHTTEPIEDFDTLLLKIKEKEEGINLPEGWVPQTELWLVENGKFIGWVKIRYQLSENLLKQGGHIGYAIRPSKWKMGYGSDILKLALPVAKGLGIKKALLTCDDDNLGSIKIIEKNGGVLENTIIYEGKLKRRYWISNK